jgi:hypothetical protein
LAEKYGQFSQKKVWLVMGINEGFMEGERYFK